MKLVKSEIKKVISIDDNLFIFRIMHRYYFNRTDLNVYILQSHEP